jgi:hypothetical protein
VECSSSEVTWGFQGSVTAYVLRGMSKQAERKRQSPSGNLNALGSSCHATCSEDVGAARCDVRITSDGDWEQSKRVLKLGADSAALGGLTGTTAEVWRSMGTLARLKRLNQVSDLRSSQEIFMCCNDCHSAANVLDKLLPPSLF